jgi:hypothetical protein
LTGVAQPAKNPARMKAAKITVKRAIQRMLKPTPAKPSSNLLLL